MKTPKTSLISGTVILSIITLVLLSSLVAGCGHYRFHDRDLSKYAMKRMEHLVDDLDLSDTQQKKYEEVLSKIEANLTDGMEIRKTTFKELQSEFNSENPDMNLVTDLFKKRLKEISGYAEETLDLCLEFYNLLDDDQKTILVKKISKRKKFHRIPFHSRFFFERIGDKLHLFPIGGKMHMFRSFPHHGSDNMLLPIVFMLAVYIYLAICLQVLAKKTGTKNGWMGWIPILNFYLFCKIGRKPGWWMVLLFIPFVNIFFAVLVFMTIAEMREKPNWWGVLIAVPLVRFVVPGYLAFSGPKQP